MHTGGPFPLLISKYWSNPGYNNTSKPGEFFKKPIELKWREDLTLPELKNDLSSAGLIKSEGVAPKSKLGIEESVLTKVKADDLVVIHQKVLWVLPEMF